eukprot:XP_011665198.1 PREDICTED: uncharacterized protein LOC105438724 [Strongylocentrotus purpuratus]
MASKFPEEKDEKVKLHTRKGHDMTWSCDKHGEPIKFYCKEHKIPVCHPCATKEHCHKPCELDDIEDVILKRRRKLDDKQQEIEEMKKQLKALSSKLESTVTSANNGKVIRYITIPMNSSTDSVYVDVDRDGMILAAQYNQSNIYLINPADGKIVNTIKMEGNVVSSKIQALSSGDIVMKTDFNEFTVISRSGDEKAVLHSDEWCEPRCRVDKLTDTLYVTYWDTERTIYAVDQVSCDGIIQARRIVEYKESDRCDYTNPCLVTPSGNIVACDGDKLFVYKKIFIL